jgi:polyphosphate kinase
MKRIGGLKQQVAAGIPQPTIDGRTPQQQLTECRAWVREFEHDRQAVTERLLELLGEHQIRLLAWSELTTAQRAALREHYLQDIFPLVTPLAVDPAHPFPFISNLSLNLLVMGDANGRDDPVVARVKVPVGDGIPRLLPVASSPGQHHFVRLEDVMAHTLDVLFPGLTVASCDVFRVTRNANTERDEEEADDLLELIESEVRDRRFAPIVRLELPPQMDLQHRGMLANELGLTDPDDVFEVTGILAHRDLMELHAIDAPELRDPHFVPLDPPHLPAQRNIFHSIRDTPSMLLLHPYESFAASVERLLREAAHDPKVRAIKMTLYRTSPDARMVSYLAEAARNG